MTNSKLTTITVTGNGEPAMVIPISSSKITSAVWGPYEEYIITGHENGEIAHYDLKTGEKVNSCKDHTKQINDLQLSKDMSMLISASKDTTAKVGPTKYSNSVIWDFVRGQGSLVTDNEIMIKQVFRLMIIQSIQTQSFGKLLAVLAAKSLIMK
jgi:WD40 repeat protein